MPATMPVTSKWLRADTLSPQIGVDREAKIIRGFVLAQEGPFKDLRGEFDVQGLKMIAKMAASKPGGLKSRFAHPSLSGDGIGTFLGRCQGAKMGMCVVDKGDGKGPMELACVRGDLHLDPTAFKTPNGDLGNYVMDLAESDPGAFSSSLVLQVDEKYRLEKNGTPKVDENGDPLPPLWYPTMLHAVDLVDTGDATDSFLSAEGLNDHLVRDAFKLLSSFLPGQSREVVEARLNAWMQRAMALRFGDDGPDELAPEDNQPTADDLLIRLRQRQRQIAL